VSVEVSAAHGHVHDAGFYASDDEFGALIVPFVEEGVDAGEPIVIGYDQRKSDLLRGWLRNPSAVTFLTDTALYATPAGAIATYGRLFAQHVALGATQIRIAGDVPHPGSGGRFEGWDRYEAAVNTVWDEFPVHSLCLYDATTISSQVKDVVERTHPHLLTATGQRDANPRYEDPTHFEGLPAVPDDLEASAPVVELHDPTSAQARGAIRQVAAGRLDKVTLADLILGVSEAASNAQVHGHPPIWIRVWTAPDRVVVHVHDRGPGPTNTLAGLVPADSATSAGLGLWLIHQLNLDVALVPAADGFTVRLRARTAPPS
jgi:anti-sigma regulatory factor (Ser/Thr protein kinase)